MDVRIVYSLVPQDAHDGDLFCWMSARLSWDWLHRDPSWMVKKVHKNCLYNISPSSALLVNTLSLQNFIISPSLFSFYSSHLEYLLRLTEERLEFRDISALLFLSSFQREDVFCSSLSYSFLISFLSSGAAWLYFLKPFRTIVIKTSFCLI